MNYTKLLRYTVLTGILIGVLLVAGIARAEEVPYWKVIMAEAVSEGYDGMYAVACVIRNRGGGLRGFYGAKRKDLDDFCKRQGQRYIVQAQAIERAIFEESSRDTTSGATHYEALERYGVPYWAGKMRETCKIGEHTFFKEN